MKKANEKTLKEAAILFGEIKALETRLKALTNAKTTTEAKQILANMMDMENLNVFVCKDRHGSDFSLTYVKGYMRKPAVDAEEAARRLTEAGIDVPYKKAVEVKPSIK